MTTTSLILTAAILAQPLLVLGLFLRNALVEQRA